MSWQVLREDRRLIVFPLVSAAVSLLIGAAAFGIADGAFGSSAKWRTVFVVAMLIASFPITFTTLFCGVALASVLARKLDGAEVTASDGWRAARERSGIIAAWALLVCTVGAILRVIEEYVPVGARIAVWLVSMSWTLATLFAVPVLAYEGLGPRATLKRSVEIFRARWGEQAAGILAIGFGTGLLLIPAIVLVLAGVAVGGAGGIALVAIGGAAILAVQAFSIALNQVYRVFLYRSAVGDPATPAGTAGPFSAEDLANPFRARKGRPA